MKKLLPFLLAVVGLSACHDEASSPAVPVFTITIHVDNSFTNSDHWIEVRDNETGTLLGSRHIKDSNPVVFETSMELADGKISVSHLQTGPSAIGGSFWHVDVYNGVAAGSKWSIRHDNGGATWPVPSPRRGDYYFTINNAPTPYAFVVSSAYNSSRDGELKSGRLTGKFDIRETPSKQYFMIDADGPARPKYGWIDNVNNLDQLQLDYNGFVEFDSYLKVNFPATKKAGANVYAYDEAKRQYTLYTNWSWALNKIESSEIELGFLNEFSDYAVDLTLDDFRFTSRGPKPSSIKVSQWSDFGIKGTSIDTYSLTNSEPYSYSISYFEIPITNHLNGKSFSVTYHSPAGTEQHHEPLSPTLTTTFGVNFKLFKYTGAHIMVSGRSYEDLLDSEFDPDYIHPTTYERAWLE